ncbi:hypothetical protein BH24ACT5_BH24ACT5_06160 [soil metagenome]
MTDERISFVPTPAPDLNGGAMEAARQRWTTRAKPPGALGVIEQLAVHLAGVTGCCPPPVPRFSQIAVFAGDHGVVADGASAWPSEVTAAMVRTISGGGAAINAFARTIGASVTVIDVGVAAALPEMPGVIDRRLRPGTASIARSPAMTVAEATASVTIGSDTANRLVDDGADCLIGGEMGIGNTTPAAALISAITGRSPDSVTGTGAGVPELGLEHKCALVTTAVARTEGWSDPLILLAEVGGLEIGALAGFYIAAARRRVPFVLGCVIAGAALCLADLLAPGTARRAIAGHRSAEPAATFALEHLGLCPLLDLDLRLGEGTGATLAVPLLVAAARALADMADLPTT